MQALQDEQRLKSEAAIKQQEMVFRGQEGALDRASNERLGSYQAGGAPSNVREYEHYMSLDPAGKLEYLEMKRAGNMFGTGGGGQSYLPPGATVPRQVVAPSDATALDAERARQIAVQEGRAGIDVDSQDPTVQADLDAQRLANETAALEAKKAGESRALAVAAKDDAKYLIDEILGMDISGVYGSIESRLPTFRQDTANAESAISRLGNLLTLENLGKMSGVLTDRDMSVLANAASEIQNFKIDETRADSELRRIKAILEKASGATPAGASKKPSASESYEDRAARLLK